MALFYVKKPGRLLIFKVYNDISKNNNVAKVSIKNLKECVFKKENSTGSAKLFRKPAVRFK